MLHSDIERSLPLLPSLSGWMTTLIQYVQSGRPDLTNRQMGLMLLVYLTPGPHTVRGLAAKLKVSKPVVTRALNTLGTLGYLRRQKDASDLRNIFVETTAKGADFLRGFASLIQRGEDDRQPVEPERRSAPVPAH